MYCRKCGEFNSQEAKFCKRCGEALHSNVPEPVEPEPQERIKKKSQKQIFIPLIIVIIVAVLASLFIVVSKVQKEKRYDKQVEAGQKYLEEEEYEKAVVCLNEAIDIDPKQVEPYRDLARAYIGLEDHEKVKETYEAVTSYITGEYDESGELPVDSITVYKEAIQYYHDQGDTDNAQKLTEEIVDMVDDEKEEEEIRELTRQSSMYQKYYDLLVEYQGNYGTAEMASVDREGYWKYLKGLCFAKLIDFDQDECEELILAYADPSTYGNDVPQYVIEVWRYNKNEIEKVFTGEGYGNDGGTRTLYLSCVDDKYYIIEGMADDFEYDYIWELQDETFIQTKTLEGEFGEDGSYTIDGAAVSMDEFSAESDRWWEFCVAYGLSRSEEDEEKSLEALEETFDRLEEEE